jgi:hypothetical protein
MTFGYESVELSSVLGFQVFKTCNCHHFQCSVGIESCESVEVSSLFCFLGPEIRRLERVGSVIFFVFDGFWVRKCRTVVIFRVLGVQNV